MRETNECEGACRNHRGPVRLVKEWGICVPKDEPWLFNYCDEAISRDRRRGFIVEEVTSLN